MSDLATSRQVRTIARKLGWQGQRSDAVEFVIDHCRRFVDRCVETFEPQSLNELLDAILAKIGLVVEEIHSDVDLEDICSKYIARGELTFGRVRTEFNATTFALVVRLDRPDRGNSHVAVIDCRGAKGSRRWFSIWHEIAHLITNPQLELNFRRCAERDQGAEEALMDVIAGKFGYHEALFAAPQTVSLAAFETHRLRFAPESSREAAFYAAVKSSTEPATFVVAELGLKASQKQALRTPSLFPKGSPQPELRAIKVVAHRDAEAAGLFVPKNMRVPEASVIARVFTTETMDLGTKTWSAVEDMNWWRSSDGRARPARRVQVEAGRCGRDRVVALIVGL